MDWLLIVGLAIWLPLWFIIAAVKATGKEHHTRQEFRELIRKVALSNTRAEHAVSQAKQVLSVNKW